MLVTGYWRLDAGYSIKKLADQAKTRWYRVEGVKDVV
jgi:hypothetical protein